jgi:hypothetical protein
MTRASDTHPKGRDVEQARFMGSAVANGDAPNPRQDHPMNKTNPVTAEDVERACEAFWSHMKLIGCSKGFHEGASETFADQPEDDEKRELRDCIRAAMASLSSTPSDTGDELREAGKHALRELDCLAACIYHADQREEVQAVANRFRAALSKAPQATRSDDGVQWRCVNCKWVTPTKHQIAPERCAECKCSQFAEVAATRSDEPQLTPDEEVELVHRINANPNLHPRSDGEIEGWQPIETAPKDGTYLLLASGENVTTGRCIEDGRWFETNSDPTDYWDGELQPTHWRPLPDPPGALNGEG